MRLSGMPWLGRVLVTRWLELCGCGIVMPLAVPLFPVSAVPVYGCHGPCRRWIHRHARHRHCWSQCDAQRDPEAEEYEEGAAEAHR